MSILAQTGDGDLAFTAGRLTLATGGDETAARMRNRTYAVKGEWFLDTTVGLPYFEIVFVAAPDLDVIRRMYTEAYQKIPGVKRLDSLDLLFNRASRDLEVSVVAITDEGAIITGGSGVPFVVEDLT